MLAIGIVGNGPISNIPNLKQYEKDIDLWIGADRGALTIINNDLDVSYAVGDFDSVCEQEKELLKRISTTYIEHPPEKDETDIELSLRKAFELKPTKIYLFGVTGGRLDHELINIQLLYTIVSQHIRGIIIDKTNQLELTTPDHYIVTHDNEYPNISFIPYTKVVKGLTLTGFYYPLFNKNISWGSTLCISNKLLLNNGTFLYKEGILLIIKSRES